MTIHAPGATLATLLIITAALAIDAAHAGLVVTDRGTTTPTLAAEDTGYTGAMGERFGFDAGETHGQSFTLSAAGTLGSIFIAYNGFDSAEGTLTITVDAGDDGSVDLTETVTLNASDFSGDPTSDNNDGPIYWMQWDLSSNGLALPVGLSSFEMKMDSESAGPTPTWLFAPMYSTGDPYPDGEVLGLVGDVGPANSDAGFVVTLNTVPSDFAITEFTLVGDIITLTWKSQEGVVYAVKYSTDLSDWDADLNDSIAGDAGETTTRSFDLTEYGIENNPHLFLRVERGG